MGYIFLVPGSVITYALQLHDDPELHRCSDIDLKVGRKRELETLPAIRAKQRKMKI